MKTALVVLVGLFMGCQAEPGPALAVFAASSLTEAFTAICDAFEAEDPGHAIELQFGGSQTLAAQIEHGAPADVFAPAAPEYLDRLKTQGRVDPPVAFAANHLAVLYSERAAASTVDQLPAVERVVLGTPEVPVGRYADAWLAKMDKSQPGFAQSVYARVVSRETNVRLVRAKVEMGEADAAIVYRTDAMGRPHTRVVDIQAESPVVSYVAARVRSSQHPNANKFVRFLQSEQAQTALRRFGFEAP